MRDYDAMAVELEATATGPDAKRQPLSAVSIAEFLSMEIPARKHLLSPVLPEQGLMMIHGPRGLGKTHLSVGIAVAVASGDKFLRWSAPNPAGVLLVDGEMPASSLQERLAKAVQASEKEVTASLRIVTPDLNRDAGMPDLSTTAGQAAVDALVGDAKLIVLDNLSSLMRSGVENDAESWQPLQTWALRHRAQGRSVIFIHHSGKGGAQRGTSRREDVLDTVIGLRRPSDYSQTQGARFEIHIDKGPRHLRRRRRSVRGSTDRRPPQPSDVDREAPGGQSELPHLRTGRAGDEAGRDRSGVEYSQVHRLSASQQV